MQAKHYTAAETAQALAALITAKQDEVLRSAQALSPTEKGLRKMEEGVYGWFIRMGLAKGAYRDEAEMQSLMEGRLYRLLAPRPEILTAYRAYTGDAHGMLTVYLFAMAMMTEQGYWKEADSLAAMDKEKDPVAAFRQELKVSVLRDGLSLWQNWWRENGIPAFVWEVERDG